MDMKTLSDLAGKAQPPSELSVLASLHFGASGLLYSLDERRLATTTVTLTCIYQHALESMSRGCLCQISTSSTRA